MCGPRSAAARDGGRRPSLSSSLCPRAAAALARMLSRPPAAARASTRESCGSVFCVIIYTVVRSFVRRFFREGRKVAGVRDTWVNAAYTCATIV